MRVFVLFLLAAAPAQAAEYFCVAPFDETSRYELQGKVGEKTAHFAYRANDIDLDTDLAVIEVSFDPGRGFRLQAENENMRLKAGTLWENGQYAGEIQVSFSLDDVEPVGLDLHCQVMD